MSYARRIPSVPTYNGVGFGLGSVFATERTTEWNIPVKSPYDGVGIWPFDDEEGDTEVGGEGPPQIDQTPPPKFCGDGSVALVSNGTAYCPQSAGGGTPSVTPPKTVTLPAPPKTTPGPAPAVAPPVPASSGGLSTMTLIGGGVATLAVVGGLVYWKKKGGKFR